eukprot:100816-Chlamydomonas_euryale.AAC.4
MPFLLASAVIPAHEMPLQVVFLEWPHRVHMHAPCMEPHRMHGATSHAWSHICQYGQMCPPLAGLLVLHLAACFENSKCEHLDAHTW